MNKIVILSSFEGFAPTLAAEYFENDGYDVNHETIYKNTNWVNRHKRVEDMRAALPNKLILDIKKPS